MHVDAPCLVRQSARVTKRTTHRVLLLAGVEVFLVASIPMAFRAEVHARQEERAGTSLQMCWATEATAFAPVAVTASRRAARSVTTAMVMTMTVAGGIAPSAGNPVPTVMPVALPVAIRQQ